LLALPVAMVNPAAAQQPTPEQIEAIRQACRSDFISHCSGVQPGGREALQCLQRNVAQLSLACGGAISAAAPNPGPPRPVTAAPQPQPSQPQPSQPSEQDQLSAARRACTLDDFMSHCSWIQPSNPELLLCLRANAGQLSPGCQAAVGANPGANPAAAETPAPAAAPAAGAPPPPAAAAAPPPAAAEPPPAPAAPALPAAAKRPSSKQISAIRAACRSDFISHCSGVQPGSREALQCLERNKAAVSQPCQGALAALGGTATGAPAAQERATPPPAAASPPPAESFSVRRLRPREQFAILRACALDARDLCDGIPPGGGRIIRCLARNASQLSSQCRAALAEARE
jgi:hypothetical protein